MWSCHRCDKKAVPCLAFESVTVVLLSSYHPVSVNAVSSIIYESVCVIERRETLVWQLFSSLFSPVSFILSVRLHARTHTHKHAPIPCVLKGDHRQPASEKRNGTDNKRMTELDVKKKRSEGERLGKITREGGREGTENNINQEVEMTKETRGC